MRFLCSARVLRPSNRSLACARAPSALHEFDAVYGTDSGVIKYEACFVFGRRPACAGDREGISAMSVSTTFDLLLRGGRVIDPASGVDGLKDVAIRGGKIAAIQSDILPTSAREVVDVADKIVLPGLIDTHAHVYQYVTGRFGVNADMVGVQSGVT